MTVHVQEKLKQIHCMDVAFRKTPAHLFLNTDNLTHCFSAKSYNSRRERERLCELLLGRISVMPQDNKARYWYINFELNGISNDMTKALRFQETKE